MNDGQGIILGAAKENIQCPKYKYIYGGIFRWEVALGGDGGFYVKDVNCNLIPIGGAGAQGPQGATGPQGPAGGPQGNQGSQGTQGTQGSQGNQGSQGSQGSQGAPSIVPGPPGPQGFQGSSGSQGVQGAQGTTGAQGPQGITGAQGAQGTIGGSSIISSGGNIAVGTTLVPRFIPYAAFTDGALVAITEATAANFRAPRSGTLRNWRAKASVVLVNPVDVFCKNVTQGTEITFTVATASGEGQNLADTLNVVADNRIIYRFESTVAQANVIMIITNEYV